MEKTIYLDHAATTFIRGEVLQEMTNAYMNYGGNPSSLHEVGQQAKKQLENARRDMAALLCCQAGEVFFTSGGTEADNWALKGAFHAEMQDPCSQKRNRILASSIEHPAVLRTLDALKKEGAEVELLDVDDKGCVSLETIQNAINEKTLMVSCMLANNEVGSIQKIKEIAALCHEKGILVHTDAVQAVGKIPISFIDLGVDLLSLSAHKFYGPKGIGALIVKRGTKLDSFASGGSQERGKRAGTEDLPGILGMVRALKLSLEEMESVSERLCILEEEFLQSVRKAIPDVHINSNADHKVPGLMNLRFDHVEGESLAVLMDMKGVCVSTASACEAGSVEPSHVLMAMGLTKEQARNAIRLSMGRETTKEEMERAFLTLKEAVERLRSFTLQN